MINLEQANPKYANLIGENYHHYMIVIGDVIQHPIRMEMPLLKNDWWFISKHLPDMKFSYVDERLLLVSCLFFACLLKCCFFVISIKEFFGYNVNDLIGTSFYQYFDGNDCKKLGILFKTCKLWMFFLFQKNFFAFPPLKFH